MQLARTTFLTLSLAAVLATAVAGAAAAQEGAKPAAAPVPKDSPEAPVYTHWESFGVEDGLPSNKVTYVLPAGDDLWVGTDKGLALRRDGAWKVFTPKDGLAYPVISSLAVSERTGDLWIGTLGGLSRYSAGRFDSFGQLDSGLINDVIYAVDVFDGDVWTATAAGVSVYHPDSKTWDLFDHTNTVMHEPWCYGLTAASERIYVAVWGGGVVEHDPARKAWKAYRDPDQEMEIDLFRDDGLVHDVTSGVSHSGGILWVGTYFGLSRYDGRTWRSYLEHDTPLPSNFINVVQARGDWVWIGTDNGLASFDGDRWIVYRRSQMGGGGTIEVRRAGEEPKVQEAPSAMAHNYILWVHPEEDRVWVATSAGLSVGTRKAPLEAKEVNRKAGPKPVEEE